MMEDRMMEGRMMEGRMMAAESFTIDTYFLLSVLATVLYMCARKVWDGYFNKKKYLIKTDWIQPFFS
jgi:hypothetical protein